MSEETGFVLPEEEVNRIRKRLWNYILGAPMWVPITIPVTVGLLYYMGTKIHVILLAIITTLIIGYVMFAIMMYRLRHHKYIYLSRNGIRGFDTLGKKAEISWDDDITLGNSPLKNIHSILLVPKNGRPVLLPLAIARMAQFRDVFSTYAPQNFPIHQFTSSISTLIH